MMKAVQFTIEEAREYLARRRERTIRDAYRRGYGEKPVAAEEFGPLMESQSWPDE